jgi:hypothetical protein
LGSVGSFYTTFIPVVITGTREDYRIIVVSISGYLPSSQFYSLVNFLREQGYYFDRVRRLWFKKSKNLDEDMNALENFLIDHDISFINRHPLFYTIPSEQDR